MRVALLTALLIALLIGALAGGLRGASAHAQSADAEDPAASEAVRCAPRTAKLDLDPTATFSGTVRTRLGPDGEVDRYELTCEYGLGADPGVRLRAVWAPTGGAGSAEVACGDGVAVVDEGGGEVSTEGRQASVTVEVLADVDVDAVFEKAQRLVDATPAARCDPSVGASAGGRSWLVVLLVAGAAGCLAAVVYLRRRRRSVVGSPSAAERQSERPPEAQAESGRRDADRVDRVEGDDAWSAWDRTPSGERVRPLSEGDVVDAAADPPPTAPARPMPAAARPMPAAASGAVMFDRYEAPRPPASPEPAAPLVVSRLSPAQRSAIRVVLAGHRRGDQPWARSQGGLLSMVALGVVLTATEEDRSAAVAGAALDGAVRQADLMAAGGLPTKDMEELAFQTAGRAVEAATS